MTKHFRVIALSLAVAGALFGAMCAAMLQQNYQFFSFLLSCGLPFIGAYIGYTIAVLVFWFSRRD